MSKQSVLTVLASLAIAGAAWFVYGRALGSPFIFDDSASVSDNRSIVALWPLIGDSEHPGPLNPPNDTTTSGRPLVNLSLAVNYHFGLLNPFGYHVFNLVVHVLSAILLMAIVRRTLQLDCFEGRFDRASGPLAFVAALLWAVHPLQTETVVYVTQRTELLAGFFYLTTLYASLRYWAASAQPARKLWLAIATSACLAGMACKEMMVTAPAIVLLFERTFIAGTFRRAFARSWPLYVGLAGGWVLLLWLNFNGPRSATAGFHLGVPAVSWWITQSKVLWIYLKLAIWPWPLSIHYEPYLLLLKDAWPWVAATVLLVAISLWLCWRRYAIGFVSAWAFIILSPTLVVPITTELVAERRMYLPLAAVVTLLVVEGFWLTQQAAAHWGAARDRRESSSYGSEMLAAAVGLFVAVVLSFVSVRRLAAYQNELTLWQDDVIHQPEDPIAHYNLATELDHAGEVQRAIEHYQLALRFKPEYPSAHNNLGMALASRGRLQEAIEQYQKALQSTPDYADAYNNLGNALSNTGRLPEAIEQYRLALRLKPDFAAAHFNFGLTLVRAGQFEEAAHQYQLAIEFDPEMAQAHQNLALALAQLKRSSEAIASAKTAIELAKAQGQTVLAQQIEKWLVSYRGGLGATDAPGISRPAAPP